MSTRARRSRWLSSGSATTSCETTRPRRVAQMRLPIAVACRTASPSPMCLPSLTNAFASSVRCWVATVSRIDLVAMRISRAAIDVGLENASQAALTMNSVRSRAFSAPAGNSCSASVSSAEPLSTTAISNPSRSPKWYCTTPQVTPARSVMCLALAAANPSSRMQRTVSSITRARVRSARSWLSLAGRLGLTTGAMASRSPHQTADVRGRQVLRGEQAAGSGAYRFDHVDRAGCGGDHAALVVIDAGHSDVGVDLDARVASDGRAVHAGAPVGWIRPVRSGGVGEPVDVFHGDDRQARTDTLDREPDGGHPSRGHRHHHALDRFGRHPGFVTFTNVVQLDAEAVGEASDLSTPQGSQHTGLEHDRRVIWRGAESHADAREFGVVVAAVVEDLLNGDRGGTCRQAQRGVHKRVAGEAGVDAVDVQRGVARLACPYQRFAQPVVGMLSCDQPDHRGANDIGAGSQESGYLIDCVTGTGLGLRRVHHTVGVNGDQRVDVVGGHHAAGFSETTQLGGVAAHLLRAVGVHADEFEIGAPDDRAQRVAAHISGGELEDSWRS